MHPDILTVPVATALGELVSADGATVLKAIVLGNDLLCRLSLASSRRTQWFDTSIHGVFGAALCGGIVMGLKASELTNALGLALNFASGTKQAIIERSHAKRYLSAFAASNAVRAVLLAAAGVEDPAAFFTGKAGYFAQYDTFDITRIMTDYGVRFENEAISYKKYPSCQCNFTPIAAALKLREHIAGEVEKVKSIRITITPYMNEIVGGEFLPEKNPTVAGVFSIRYVIACALFRGEVQLAGIERESVMDKNIGFFANQIEIEVERNWDGFTGPARIEATLKDGRTFQVTVTDVPGGMSNPLTENDLLLKIHDCFEHGPQNIGLPDAARTWNIVKYIDKEKSISSLFKSF